MQGAVRILKDNFMLVCFKCGSFEGPLYSIPERNGQFLTGYLTCCEGCLNSVVPEDEQDEQ